ncbi:putative claudin-24 [Spea bombifrons]|uniref:putative claudin-24 n=1 Tax=Spea bombifrons TaxID=233779 RepID=UPI00234BF5E7|nr:putative claudin-24 [Spea bombifrons]
MHPALCFTELAGLFLSLTGYLCCLVALFIPRWLICSSGILVNESFFLGLWQTCVMHDIGSSVCQNYGTLLGLPVEIQMGRILVCLSLSAGALGFLSSIPALTCVKCLDHNQQHVRRTLVIFGAVLLELSGMLTFSFVSYLAHYSLEKYLDSTIPKSLPRWEYGDAMFSGWIGGFLLLAGGTVLMISQLYILQTVPQPIKTNRSSSNMEYV